MLDSETIIRNTHAPDDPRISVSMKDEGVELRLFFLDISGDGDVLEVQVLPDTQPVTPEALQKIGDRYSFYVQYARAAMRWDTEDVRETLARLRQFGRTSRGLSDDHYRLVARLHNALVAEGSAHPVKALAQALHTDISNASRWIKEARRRGHIEGDVSVP